MARNPGLFQVAGAVARWGGRLILLLLLVFAGLVIAYRFVNPVSTLMLGRMLLHEKVDQKWVPLSGISEALRAAVVTSEDAHFCRHHGVDWGAMREVIDDNGIGGASRGASTITMQVAKNLFLWPGRSYIRKALEIPHRPRSRFCLAEAPHSGNLPQHRRMGRRRPLRRRGRGQFLFHEPAA